jgi:hypothetical protein
MSIAFVLGNGRGRLGFDLNELHAIGHTFGCNALYRDFIPDYLCAVDYPMIEEIINAKAHLRTKLYIESKHKRYTQLPNVNAIDTQFPTGMDSGNLSVLLACKLNFTKIYMLGYDYISHNGLNNNVYTGTRLYRQATDVHAGQPTIQSWYHRLMIVMARYPNTEFIRVNGNDFIIPVEADNYKQITKQEFLDEFPTFVLSYKEPVDEPVKEIKIEKGNPYANNLSNPNRPGWYPGN